MLTSDKSILLKAYRKGYSIPQININNLEWIKAALITAQESNSPIILGVSEKASEYMGGFRNVFSMVKCLDSYYKIKVPVFVHLDHGTFEGVKQALDADFTSIMFDGSQYSLEENISKTQQVLALCRQKGVLLEAKAGCLNINNCKTKLLMSSQFSDPEVCRSFASLKIDMLAIDVGNNHGLYSAGWKGLNLDILTKIKEKTNCIPLVLHGGTGIPDNMIYQSISYGVVKININTACQLAFATATQKYILAQKDFRKKGFEFRNLFKPGFLAIKEIIRQKINLFGSLNRA